MFTLVYLLLSMRSKTMVDAPSAANDAEARQVARAA
jgi:hypothetical protein